MTPKHTYQSFIAILLISLSACDTTYSGKIDVSGICLDTCNGAPLVNHKVRFSRLLESFETTTNSDGYFHLQGSYSFESRKPIEAGVISFRDNASGNNCCFQFHLNDDNLVLNGDTFYRYNTVESIIRIRLNPNLTTNSIDTLFLESNFVTYDGERPKWHRSDLPNYSINYHKKYGGPFTDGQILDTVTTLLSSHVGFTHQIPIKIIHYNPNKGIESHLLEYPFVRGQGNIECGLYQEMEITLIP